MPRKRHAKGPRLWLQPERIRNGSVERAVWCILDDGGIKRSTGCGPLDREQAEGELATYIADKRLKRRVRGRGAADIPIADVIAIYAKDIAPGHARPKETAGRLERMLAWWPENYPMLAQVTGQSCREYAAHRGGGSAARRELEDLRAAIVHHRTEGLCREVVEVWLPPKAKPRPDWLTRAQVGTLIMSAWRYREIQKGKATGRRSRRHVARFMLIARYTGTRAGAICRSSFEQRDGFGWIDLERGVWYRRPQDVQDTKKRRPPIPLPGPLLAFMRRWRADGQRFPVEFNGKPVQDVDRAFRQVARDCEIPATPHTFRHTVATWLMQNGADKWEAGGFLGMTEQTLNHYAHHHPDHLRTALEALSPRKDTESMGVNKTRQTASNVIKIAARSKGG